MIQLGRELRPLTRTIQALGLVSVLILVAGFAELIVFEPLGQHTGTRARVTGVYAVEGSSGRPVGDPQTHFGRDQNFAAIVDWSSLPPAMTVSARWYDSLDQTVGGVRAEPASGLAARGVVVLERRSPEFHHNLPGHYTLVVLRHAGGQPVEVLARRTVLVETGG